MSILTTNPTKSGILNYINRLGLDTDECFCAKFPDNCSMNNIENLLSFYQFDGVIELYCFNKVGNSIMLTRFGYDSKNDDEEYPNARISFYSLDDLSYSFEQTFLRTKMTFDDFVSQGRHIDFVIKNYKCLSKCSITKISNDNEALYKYTGKCNIGHHFYLKCNKCGTLYHVDCEYADKLSKHILEDHNFITSNEHIIINGECTKCTKGVRV